MTTKMGDSAKTNMVIRVVPSQVNMVFNPTKFEETNAVIRIINVSKCKQRVLITPPRTSYFQFTGNIANWILPGLPLNITLQFKPNMSRSYYDKLKVSCAGINNTVDITINLTALPGHPNLESIPDKINFGFVRLCDSAEYNLTLQPSPEGKFTFLLFFPRRNRDCSISPASGVVDKEPVNIQIQYRPTSYITANIPVLLYLPTISATPHCICVTAVTKPESIKDKIISGKQVPVTHEKSVTRKQNTENFKRIIAKNTALAKQKSADTTKQNLQLNVHDINLMLIRKTKPPRDPDELLGPLGTYLDEESELKKEKQKEFLMEVAQLRKENEAALLHQRDRLNEIKIDSEFLQNLFTERKAYWIDYKNALNPKYQTQTGKFIRQRTVRDMQLHLDRTFTSIVNNEWFIRLQILRRFIESVRRVIIKNRLLKRLSLLKLGETTAFILLCIMKFKVDTNR